MKGDTQRRVEQMIQDLDGNLIDETDSELAYAEACEEVSHFFRTAAVAARENIKTRGG